MSVSSDRLSELIDIVYDTALSQPAWETLVDELERLLCGVVAFVTVRDRPASVIAATINDAQHAVPYLEHYWEQDVGMQRLVASPASLVFPDSHILGPRDRARTPFYQDFLGKLGFNYGLYASMARKGDELAVMGIHRADRFGDYSEEDLELVRRLAPHLGRSLKIQRRLGERAAERDACVSALAQSRVGVILTDADGTVRFANPVAEARLRDGSLTVVFGRLQGATAQATRDLTAAIGQAARASGGIASAVAAPRRPPASPLTLMVTPLRPSNDVFSEPLAMIVLGEARDIGPEELARGYGLTPREAQLLGALVRGERLNDYAERAGVRMTTVKTHLRSLFAKTGQQRQADLVRLTLSDPILRLTLDEGS